MIEVSHVTKSYGETVALTDVSFSVSEGSICGLLGPNGAGKSTTMNIMTGCLAATSGEVRYDGREIYDDMSEVKRSIGYLPEIPPLYPEMTPFEYLTFVGRAKGMAREETLRAVSDLCERCGILHMSDRLIKNLSKGYRQRVGIASALIGDPQYIILDEPTVGLDPVQVVEVRSLIKGLAHNHTVLISSHILSEIEILCDRIVMIAHGNVVAEGTPTELEGEGSARTTATLIAETDEQTLLDVLSAVPSIGDIRILPSEEEGTVRASASVEQDADAHDAIGRALFARGVYLRDIDVSHSSLENVFLELVGGEDDEESGDAPRWPGDTGPLPVELARAIAAQDDAEARTEAKTEEAENVCDM